MIRLHITLLLLFLPLLVLSQSERDDKIKKRSERNNRPSTTTTITESSTPVFVPQNNFYNPYNPYNQYTPYRPYYPTRIRGNDNGIFNRRNSNNQVDSNRKPLNVSLGFTVGVGRELLSPSSGLFLTLGGETFLYLSYESSSDSPYEHYDNITFEEVMSWGDEKVDEFESYSSFGIGVGGELYKNISQYAGISIYGRDRDLVYYDEYFLLSDNGEYSINDKDETNFNLIYGLKFDYERMCIGTSIYFVRNRRFNINFGLNF